MAVGYPKAPKRKRERQLPGTEEQRRKARMNSADSKSESGGDKSPQEVDDQFRAIMEGLRTTIPGVMVLFSFLLILPLQSSFSEISSTDTAVFYTAFLSSALSSVLLIAPSVHQRVRAPISGIRRTTLEHVMTATRIAVVGTVLFLLSISAVVYLVSAIVFADSVAALATAGTTLIAGWAWFYVPLVRFRHRRGNGA